MFVIENLLSLAYNEMTSCFVNDHCHKAHFLISLCLVFASLILFASVSAILMALNLAIEIQKLN